MAEHYRFFDSTADDERVYTADEFAEYFRRVLTDGIFNGGTNLKVETSGSDIRTYIQLGYAWLQGYMYKIDVEPLYMQHDYPDPSLDRIDRVVIRLDKRLEHRYVRALILKGTPAVTPAPPALTRDENIFELSLAQVLVKAGKSYIEGWQITDERLNNDVCGLVNSLIQADTTEIFNQFQHWYDSQTAAFKKEWEDWFHSIQDQNYVRVSEVGTGPNQIPRRDNRGKLFADELSDGHTLQRIRELERETAYHTAYADIDNRAIGNTGKFVDFLDGRVPTYPVATIDFTRTTATTALSAGATSIPVVSVAGFKVGQEITIFDDTAGNLERPTITAINTRTNTLTVTALTKAHKKESVVCRSSLVMDTINKTLKFGGYTQQATVAITTPTTVVNAAYGTSGNGGRKLVRMRNGWLVAIIEGTFYLVNVSKDNGATWENCGYFVGNSGSPSMVSHGDTIFILVANSSNAVYSININALQLNAGNVNFGEKSKSVTTSETAVGTTSLAISPDGTTLHAAWSSKNSTYPNSFNIRYAKGTIAGDGTVTWGSLVQITSQNSTSNNGYINPCIVLRSNNNPVIIYENSYALSSIHSIAFSGTSWGQQNLVYNGSYQSSSCAVVDSNDIIHVFWHGRDDTDTVAYNIRYSKSSDGGNNWSTATKLTSGNTYSQMYPSAAIDKNNVLYVVFQGSTSASGGGGNYRIRIIKSAAGGASWSSIEDLTTNTTAGMQYPQVCANYTDFTDPLVIYQDNQSPSIKFRGTLVTGVTTPVLVEDVRLNIKPPIGSAREIVIWIDWISANLTIGGAVSMVASGANESYVAMKRFSVPLGGWTEDQFVGTASTVQWQVAARFTVSRTSTSVDPTIKRIMGAVS